MTFEVKPASPVRRSRFREPVTVPEDGNTKTTPRTVAQPLFARLNSGDRSFFIIKFYSLDAFSAGLHTGHDTFHRQTHDM